jgi:hypothetical protein
MLPSKQVVKVVANKTIIIINSCMDKITTNGTKMITVLLDNTNERIEHEHIKQQISSEFKKINRQNH